MTRFTKDTIKRDGDCYVYCPLGCGPYSPESKFIARFKNGRPGWSEFKKFLMANFTVEEYFALRAVPTKAERPLAPVEILQMKGFRFSWMPLRAA